MGHFEASAIFSRLPESPVEASTCGPFLFGNAVPIGCECRAFARNLPPSTRPLLFATPCLYPPWLASELAQEFSHGLGILGGIVTRRHAPCPALALAALVPRT